MTQEVIRSGLPEEIAAGFEQLSLDLTWAYARWITCSELYMRSKDRIKLLNESAPAFFSLIQRVLADDIQMALCRLADPAGSGRGKTNLSLRAIANALPHTTKDAPLIADVQKAVGSFTDQCKPFIAQRHKRIAHRDLEVALKTGATMLPKATVSMLGAALASAAEILNTIEAHYCQSETHYSGLAMSGAAEALVHDVAAGLRYRELQDSGIIDWSDLHNSSWGKALMRNAE